MATLSCVGPLRTSCGCCSGRRVASARDVRMRASPLLVRELAKLAASTGRARCGILWSVCSILQPSAIFSMCRCRPLPRAPIAGWVMSGSLAHAHLWSCLIRQLTRMCRGKPRGSQPSRGLPSAVPLMWYGLANVRGDICTSAFTLGKGVVSK